MFSRMAQPEPGCNTAQLQMVHLVVTGWPPHLESTPKPVGGVLGPIQGSDSDAESPSSVLGDIQRSMEAIASTGGFSRALRLNRNEGTLQSIKAKLDDEYRDFAIASALRIELQQIKIAAEQANVAVQQARQQTQTQSAIEEVSAVTYLTSPCACTTRPYCAVASPSTQTAPPVMHRPPTPRCVLRICGHPHPLPNPPRTSRAAPARSPPAPGRRIVTQHPHLHRSADRSRNGTVAASPRRRLNIHTQLKRAVCGRGRVQGTRAARHTQWRVRRGGSA
ncbi:hypothetical protein GGX14DRAFT_565647 [Mycena pura]|uniref:Uncharacterized protein n=1 Tax=Mycena pura TaxID=153505 RepID=A0AAD6VEL6_9AGAR|nr:hypothetical protein GGX14DRAFT_565647 [Mycena pura]